MATLGCLGQAMAGFKRGIGELVKALRESKHFSIPFHAIYRGGCYASIAARSEAQSTRVGAWAIWRWDVGSGLNTKALNYGPIMRGFGSLIKSQGAIH